MHRFYSSKNDGHKKGESWHLRWWASAGTNTHLSHSPSIKIPCPIGSIGCWHSRSFSHTTLEEKIHNMTRFQDWAIQVLQSWKGILKSQSAFPECRATGRHRSLYHQHRLRQGHRGHLRVARWMEYPGSAKMPSVGNKHVEPFILKCLKVHPIHISEKLKHLVLVDIHLLCVQLDSSCGIWGESFLKLPPRQWKPTCHACD